MSCQHANFLSILVANGISQRLCFLALLRNCFLLGTEQANKEAIGSFCLREIKVLVTFVCDLMNVSIVNERTHLEAIV